MSRDPENYSMAGRKAELTVLFSDVRGFTTISEGWNLKNWRP
jgi:adenylate cyclase